MSSDSEDEEQWCQQPAENEDDDEEELCSEDEQEAEVNLSEDEYAKTIAALHWIAAAAFRHQHGARQEEEGAGAAGEAGKAAAAERAPKRQRFTKAASRVCSNCGWNPVLDEQQSTEKLPIREFRCTSKGRVLSLKCRKCNKHLTPVGACGVGAARPCTCSLHANVCGWACLPTWVAVLAWPMVRAACLCVHAVTSSRGPSSPVCVCAQVITQGTCLFMAWPDRSSLVGMVRRIADWSGASGLFPTMHA